MGKERKRQIENNNYSIMKAPPAFVNWALRGSFSGELDVSMRICTNENTLTNTRK